MAELVSNAKAVDMLRADKGAATDAEYEAAHGYPKGTLSHIFAGRKRVSDKIAKRLGLRPVVAFEVVKRRGKR